MTIKDGTWTPYEDMIEAAKTDCHITEVLPTMGVRILCYIDPDGAQRYMVRHLGDVPLSTTMGMMELAKLDLWAWYQRDPDVGTCDDASEA